MSKKIIVLSENGEYYEIPGERKQEWLDDFMFRETECEWAHPVRPNLTNPQRYCLVSDNDGHDYCIPVDKKQEFEDWVYAEADEGGAEPEYAQRVEGTFTFTDPEFY